MSTWEKTESHWAPAKNQVTVNPGVREDDVGAFLTEHDLMFKTVTAGGFFSLGGMTSVDVHGGADNVWSPLRASGHTEFHDSTAVGCGRR